MISTDHERIPVCLRKNDIEACKEVADRIATLIRERNAKSEPTILGLATGSSPVPVYEELIRMHKEEGLSFANVTTFNLDEYYPMTREDLQSYWYYMHDNLFNHIDIKPENVNIPDGTVPMDEIHGWCKGYDKKIDEAGGLDILLLGIGRNGHIGFNEPGSNEHSKTRIITLEHVTKVDNSRFFGGLQYVPRRAVTMGIKTILKAKKIAIMAWGINKADAVRSMVEEKITERVPASFLQKHDDVSLYIDESAAALLTRTVTPWLVRDCKWTESLIKKAVVWLSLKLQKPILMLTENDYNMNGLNELLAQQGSTAYDVNILVFNQVQHTITGWPGGKPNADDTQRPERKEPAKKRCLVFSPHPDDDVISMGGTVLRLVRQGHEVHVAYQTSGSFGVGDDQARRNLKMIEGFNREFDVDITKSDKLTEEMINFIDAKVTAEANPVNLQKVKSLIRQEEARAALHYCGVKDSNIHYLRLPFYETGARTKRALSQSDFDLLNSLISEIKPHQIYAAGDLADPHGTHRTCLTGVFTSLDQLKGEDFMKNCYVWLYKGAWQEWPIDEIMMAVPMSPDEVNQKRKAIFYHQSQKDGALFKGEDDREFWQRAEQRNAATADLYNSLGLAQYAAIEAFVRYDFYTRELVSTGHKAF